MDTLTVQHVNRIFQYLSVPNSRLILIGMDYTYLNAFVCYCLLINAIEGIGNTADFMSRVRFQPKLLQFSTYTKEQIKIILQSRTMLDENAIELCARKVAASSGDLRKALDVCRQVAETADGQKLGNSIAVLKSFQVTTPSLLSAPLHQRLILGTLFHMTRNKAKKGITMGGLLDSYRQSCKRIKVGAVEESDFFSSCSLMESQGTVLVGKGKEVRRREVHTYLYHFQWQILYLLVDSRCN
jgi:cell division control protein 6